MYTAVHEAKFREIANTLAAEGSVPEWFKTVEYVNWAGRHKDLTAIPGAEVISTILIDDLEDYILPEQRAQWIPILSYSAPYPQDDSELTRVRGVLERKWGCGAG